MDVDENFYDDFSSFLPSPDDYNLDELDEILRSTDTQLDSSINMNTFVPQGAQSLDIQMQASQSLDGCSFNFNAFPSPAATAESSFTPPYDTNRSSSTSSSTTEEDNFNPDDFINFLNNDDFKMDLSPADSGHDATHRGTPSPTGSCASSSGSSTSGIHSDTSSVNSMSQSFAATVKQEPSSEITNLGCVESPPINSMNIKVEPVQIQSPPATITPTAPLPLSVPVVPLQTATIPAAAPVSTGYNVLQGTLIPVKTMPLTTVSPLATIQTPTPIKIEPKIAPKITTVTPKPAVTVNGAAKPITTTSANGKPKTIFLSSTDFKALMQKLNSNGKSTKINGNLNGQMPKIVMKTANGQVINGSKVVSIAGKGSSQFVPKVMKTAPMIIKQEPVKSVTATPVVNNITRSTRPPSTDINIYKGIVDEKTFKKQQRMIKNRESASLSRKKKKEYVVSLESRINDLEKENITLKGENSSLRSQLVAFAQTCQCKNSNVSDFILNSLSITSKDSITCINDQQQHVRIAPKPSHRSMKQRVLSANVKKNVAVLFAMAFMVTLNVGNFQSYLARNSIESSVEPTEENVVVASAGRRSLLWVESETEFNEKLNRTKRETELQVPPLHFLRPNRSETVVAAEQQNGDTVLPSSSKCPIGSNQTENLRLASSLHKWIGGNDYLNLSNHEKFASGMDKHVGFKLTPEYFELKSYDLPLQPTGSSADRPQKRKHNYFQRSELHTKPKKIHLPLDGGKNSLEIFKPKISEEYMRLFKGIKRQDDTFYVLSFNSDHILLPASAYNKSSRPKMALMLPAGDPSLNGDIVLMQIDCEVVNTTEVHLKSEMIPEKLRPTKFSNVSPNPNDVANNETGSHTNPPKQKPVQTESDVEKKFTAPKPYFMVTPKQQPVVNRKHVTSHVVNETVTRINKSETFGSIDSKNSSLLQRVKQTVEFLP